MTTQVYCVARRPVAAAIRNTSPPERLVAVSGAQHQRMTVLAEPNAIDHRLACLAALEKKVLWLAVWMIHHANHIRPKRDGLKVGGHQASSASSATLMTALYFDVLRAEDRVAVKPHASPVYHAIQYLLGRQSREQARALPRARRRAVVPVAHQGRRRCGFLDRVGGAGRRDDQFRRADAGLSRQQRAHRASGPRRAG